MKTILLSILICSISLELSAQIVYPTTKKVDQADNYFGNEIKDPFRWLEDDNSAETAEWVNQQNQVTFNYLKQISYRDQLKNRLTELWNFEKMSSPFKKGKYYFFYKNDGIQNQSVLYVQEGLTGQARIVFDPNKESTEGTTSLSTIGVSKDGKYLAYGLSKAGSDWVEINVLEIQTGKKLTDNLKWVKFSSIAWKGNGFYYSRYDAPTHGKEFSKKNEYHKIYFHKIGEPQEKDVLVFEDKNFPLRNFNAKVTEDEKYLIVSGSQSTSGVSLRIKDLSQTNSEFITIIDNFDNDHHVVDNIGNSLLIHTNKNAPKYQLVLVDPSKPEIENWKKIIPESIDLFESVELSNGNLVAKYLKDVTSQIRLFSLDGKPIADITLPGIGMVNELNGDKNSPELFYSFINFTSPATVYKFDWNTKKSEVYFKPKLDFKSEDYETKQVFYTSKDGTKIPMFLTYKKGIKQDGSNPTFLFGYGGFNISYTPDFRIDRSVFLENGGIYAVANLRGGGEYGETWHKAGTQLNKQNVFDDFIAAADYLVTEKYTSKDKLAIHGRSNGGLLIGTVMTQRPDIAKVAIPTVGVLDMLRYHKFTIGWAWATDYGTSDDEKHFQNLIKFSPLHNLKEAAYPATLILTGDHDDRVVPAHSFKFAATLQEKQKGSNPVLIRIDTNAGHGAGKPTSKQIEEFADMWAFVFHNLGMKMKQP